MPITPGGRFSPGDPDDWDLTTDLAAMQVSNETASANEIAAVTTQIAGLDARFTPSVASATARNAIFPTPVQGNRVYRSDLGYTEAYYATFNITTNPGGASPSGWYPVEAGAIGGTMRRTSTALSVPNGTYASLSANAAWQTLAGEGLRGGMTYNDGFVAPVTGVYLYNWTAVPATAVSIGALVNQSSVTNFTDLKAAQSSSTSPAPVAGSARLYIPAGQYVRLFGAGLGGAPAINSGGGAEQSITWLGRPV